MQIISGTHPRNPISQSYPRSVLTLLTLLYNEIYCADPLRSYAKLPLRRVKFILPALTEATSPYWRPIKYSLFPPLGLATLAAYLNPDDEAIIIDEHVEQLVLDDEPDLVVIQVYITNAYRAYAIADHYRHKGCSVTLGGLH